MLTKMMGMGKVGLPEELHIYAHMSTQKCISIYNHTPNLKIKNKMVKNITNILSRVLDGHLCN